MAQSINFTMAGSDPPTGPNSPPESVTAASTSSTSLLINWTEVQAIDRNGEITMYQIQYEPLETFMGMIGPGCVNTTNGSLELEVVLEGLEEYVSYNISVRAYTSVGGGPFSSGVLATTLQDGKTGLFLIPYVTNRSPFPIVPSASPLSVQVNTTNSTSILITWEQLPAIDQNGGITHYEVQYKPLETFSGMLVTTSANSTATFIFLVDLQEYVNYSISVRAYTEVGYGPYSPNVTAATESAGKLYNRPLASVHV